MVSSILSIYNRRDGSVTSPTLVTQTHKPAKRQALDAPQRQSIALPDQLAKETAQTSELYRAIFESACASGSPQLKQAAAATDTTGNKRPFRRVFPSKKSTATSGQNSESLIDADALECLTTTPPPPFPGNITGHDQNGVASIITVESSEKARDVKKPSEPNISRTRSIKRYLTQPSKHRHAKEESEPTNPPGQKLRDKLATAIFPKRVAKTSMINLPLPAIEASSVTTDGYAAFSSTSSIELLTLKELPKENGSIKPLPSAIDTVNVITNLEIDSRRPSSSRRVYPVEGEASLLWTIGSRLVIIGIIALASFMLSLYLIALIPDVSFFPKTIPDVKRIAQTLKWHTDGNGVGIGVILMVYSYIYIFMQTFAIPGSWLMNLLGGALFHVYSLPLTCLLTAVGSCFSYVLSALFGSAVVRKLFPVRMAVIRNHVQAHRQQLFFYMLFVRAFPFTPNWFINIAAPYTEIPLSIFFTTILLGSAPYNFIWQVVCSLGKYFRLHRLTYIPLQLRGRIHPLPDLIALRCHATAADTQASRYVHDCSCTAIHPKESVKGRQALETPQSQQV